jgi:hypothetical protein
VPELLPRLVALFVDAERNSSFDMVKPALQALEVRQSAVNAKHFSWCDCGCMLSMLCNICSKSVPAL